MKYLAILTLTVAVLGLGACSHNEPAHSTSTVHSTGTTYSK